jgi:hypothetical protein
VFLDDKKNAKAAQEVEMLEVTRREFLMGGGAALGIAAMPNCLRDV